MLEIILNYARKSAFENLRNAPKIANYASKCSTFSFSCFCRLITVEIVYDDIGYNDEPDITTE